MGWRLEWPTEQSVVPNTLAAAFVTLCVTCVCSAFAQGIGTQAYVNRRINEMVMNRAILRQATHGRGHSGRQGRHHAAHHRTRTAKKSRGR